MSVSTKTHQKIETLVSGIDSLDMTAIFTLFLTESTTAILEQSLKYLLFPIAALASLIKAFLAVREAKLYNGNYGTFTKAFVEVGFGLAATFAIVIALVPAIGLAFLTPFIFGGAILAKCFYHLGAATWYFGKSLQVHSQDYEAKQTYRKVSAGHLVGGLATGLAAVAVGCVMILGKPLFTIAGIIAGIMGTCYAIAKGIKLYKDNSELSSVVKPIEEFNERERLLYDGERRSYDKDATPTAQEEQKPQVKPLSSDIGLLELSPSTSPKFTGDVPLTAPLSSLPKQTSPKFTGNVSHTVPLFSSPQRTGDKAVNDSKEEQVLFSASPNTP